MGEDQLSLTGSGNWGLKRNEEPSDKDKQKQFIDGYPTYPSALKAYYPSHEEIPVVDISIVEPGSRTLSPMSEGENSVGWMEELGTDDEVQNHHLDLSDFRSFDMDPSQAHTTRHDSLVIVAQCGSCGASEPIEIGIPNHTQYQYLCSTCKTFQTFYLDSSLQNVPHVRQQDY